MRLGADEITWSVGGRDIVDRVSIDCPPGTVTGLLGPNGSGKSSLLHLLGGLRRPNSGRVFVGGQDVHKMPGRARARTVALVEQESDTRLALTVRGVVELGRTPHRSSWALARDGGGDGERVEQAMTLARVEHLAGRKWATLSGGERQRAHLARAIAQESCVLLAARRTDQSSGSASSDRVLHPGASPGPDHPRRDPRPRTGGGLL